MLDLNFDSCDSVFKFRCAVIQLAFGDASGDPKGEPKGDP